MTMLAINMPRHEWYVRIERMRILKPKRPSWQNRRNSGLHLSPLSKHILDHLLNLCSLSLSDGIERWYILDGTQLNKREESVVVRFTENLLNCRHLKNIVQFLTICNGRAITPILQKRTLVSHLTQVKGRLKKSLGYETVWAAVT